MSAFGAWLLVFLLALDLIGAPFHAHRHDLGADGLSSHALHAEHWAGGSEPVHIEAGEAGAFSHSLAALVPAPVQPGKWQPVAYTSAYGPQRAVCTEIPVPVARAPRQESSARPAIPACLHLRPEGRAPPLLHT